MALPRLREKIRDKSATTGMVGLGYVGVPLAWLSPRQASMYWVLIFSKRG